MKTKPYVKVASDFNGLRSGLSLIADKSLFCVYKSVPHAKKPDKARKIPYIKSATNNGFDVLRGQFDVPQLPTRLWTLEEAIAVCESGDFDGVGLGTFPGCGVVAIDFDNCAQDGRPALSDYQKSVFKAVGPYAFIERSMSGQGYHAIVIADGVTEKDVPNGVEVFGNKNFVALTGVAATSKMGFAAQPCPPEAIRLVYELVAQSKGVKSANSAKRICGSNLAAKSLPVSVNRDVTAYPPPTVESVSQALRYIKSDDYDEWRNVGWGIKDGLGDTDESFEVFDQWSQRCVAKYDLPTVKTLWDNEKSDRAERVTIGTLFHMAMQNGWVPPWKVTALQTHITTAGAVAVVEAVVPISETLNDAGNAARLHLAFAQNVKYISANKTYAIYSNGCWGLDKRGHVVSMAMAVMRTIFDEAKTQPDPDTLKRVAGHASRSLDEKRIRGALELFNVMPGVATQVTDWDSDPDLVLSRNGYVIDLRTGRARDATRNDLMLKTLGVDYQPDATCPLWEETLNQVFEGDDRLVGYMQRNLGYSMTGHTSEQIFTFLYGEGSNGKSLVLNVSRAVLGGYAIQTQPEAYMTRRDSGNGPTPQLARMAGARLAISNEVSDGAHLDEAVVKQLTGCNPVVARFLHGQLFEYIPVAKHIMAGNHKPQIRGDDHAIWRRMVLVPFRRKFSDHEKDPVLPDKLRMEYPGILNWFIQGAVAWYASGLQVPDVVKQEVTTYRSDMDLIGQWIETALRKTEGVTTPARQLYQRFAQWCQGGGHTPISETRFAARMAARGFAKVHTNKGRAYVGVSLTATLI